MAVGTVCWFDERKGFGFIRCTDEEQDLFVHYKGIAGDGYKTLKRGWVVEFRKILCDKNRNGSMTFVADDVKPIIKP